MKKQLVDFLNEQDTEYVFGFSICLFLIKPSGFSKEINGPKNQNIFLMRVPDEISETKKVVCFLIIVKTK